MDLSSHGGDIPIPISSKYVHGHGPHGHGSFLHDHDHDHHLPTSKAPPLPPPAAAAAATAVSAPPPPPPPPPPAAAAAPLSTTTNTTTPEDDDQDQHLHLHLHQQLLPYSKKAAAAAVKYRECLKNHAASIGGNATDGCGEFMPSGEEGTMEALKCSACHCHRNFHRKEVEGEPYYQHHLLHSSSSTLDFFHPHHHHLNSLKGSCRKVIGQKGVLISGSVVDGYNHNHNHPVAAAAAAAHNNSALIPHHMIMPLGAIQTSESDDQMEGGIGGGGIFSRPGHYGHGHHPLAKKRFRTKFTAEQKEKMLSFAERVGWRLQKQEEGVVQHFCQEIGVKRRVLKVWMHNNKHNFAKKNTTTIQLE